jgi:hypothetical protein
MTFRFLTSTKHHFLTLLMMVSTLSGLSSGASAAPKPPLLATEWQYCRAQFSAPSMAPADASYPGGISEKGNQLTPPSIPGVTTITVPQANCLMDRMGKELVVAGNYSKGDAVAYSLAMPLPGTTQKTFTDAERASITAQITTVVGTRKERPVLVYCHHESCMLSHNAAIRLVEEGYKNVFWMRDGVKGWKAAGLRTGTMYGIDRPATNGAAGAIPTGPHLRIGYTEYPRPPWELLKNTSRVTINGKQFVPGRLCLMMGSELKRTKDKKAAESGFDLYQWQAYLYDMAQVDPRVDNDVVERRKMQAFWREHGERFQCGYLGGFVVKGSLLKQAIVNDIDSFLKLYLHEWRLPVNTVDHSDGFTAVEAIINAHNSPFPNEMRYRSAYDTLRWLGGLTRREAEAAGVNPTERQLQGRYIQSYREMSNGGSHLASHRLSWMYMQGDHVDANPAEAARWYDLAERQAIAAADYEFMVDIGRAYMRWKNEHNTREWVPMRPENNNMAMQWFQRAAEGRNRSGMYQYGRGLLYGWAGQKDEERALLWLTQAFNANEDQAAVHIANLYARRGDRDNAARWGRSIHPASFGSDSTDVMPDLGMGIGTYFKKNGLSWCGPRAPGLEARAASECAGGQ